MKRIDLALFILRVGVGLALMLGHGIPKLMNFPELAGTFPDPLRIGSTASLSLAIFGEVVSSLALILGFYGRWAAAIMATMLLVAFFIHHASDPYSTRELALMYLIPLVALVIAGPGRWSVRRGSRTGAAG